MEKTTFKISESEEFKEKAILWANKFSTFCVLDNNGYSKYRYSSLEFTIAVDSVSTLKSSNFDALENYKKDKHVFGYFSYDLKNCIENLSSDNLDTLEMPLLFFFEPRYLIELKNDTLTINRNYIDANFILDSINAIELNSEYIKKNIKLNLNVSKKDYLKNVEEIRNHIKKGDIYELNYCVEYSAQNTEIDAVSLFNQINKKSKSPFSSLLKFEDYYILCFSPERFLKREKNKLISQPIKGTIKKSADSKENQKLQLELKNDTKERAENVMIVDLVRNDLAKSAKRASVEVEELFEIYGFETINQMVSTIVAEAQESLSNTEILKNTFPMGSMTGAPKIRAMQIIEKMEKQKRGLYSGSIGYFTKDGNFDFNVVIRSLIYSDLKRYLSLQVGGAITFHSIPEKEWLETKEKVKAIVNEL